MGHTIGIHIGQHQFGLGQPRHRGPEEAALEVQDLTPLRVCPYLKSAVYAEQSPRHVMRMHVNAQPRGRLHVLTHLDRILP